MPCAEYALVKWEEGEDGCGLEEEDPVYGMGLGEPASRLRSCVRLAGAALEGAVAHLEAHPGDLYGR